MYYVLDCQFLYRARFIKNKNNIFFAITHETTEIVFKSAYKN